MKIAYITDDGKLVRTEGRLFTGVYDQNGRPIFDGDRVKVYIPMLDEHKDGTVEYFVDEGTYPQWLVHLDEKYTHVHLLENAHGIPSYDTEYSYLDGNYVTVVSPIQECLDRFKKQMEEKNGK